MSLSKRRVRAIFRKELREYRHNGNIIVAMVIFPLIFLSSAFVPERTLPSWLQVFARHQPITHAVNTVRALADGRYPAGDLLWTIAWIAALLLIFAPLATRRFARLA